MPITPLPQGIPYPDLTRTPDFPRPEVDLGGDGVQSYLDDSSDVIQTPTGGVQPAPEPTAPVAPVPEAPKSTIGDATPESYARLDPALSNALKAVGAPPITSGYRSPQRNAAVGGAKASYHMHGKAADIDMSGMNDAQRAQLVQDLRAQGVTRFGTYDNHPNMLHVDLGKPVSGDTWFMHNKSNRNMANAPGWFKGVQGIDVRTASTDTMPPQMQVPGDPATGYSQVPGDPATGYSPVTMNKRDLEDASSMEKGLTNPYSMLGLGLLSVLGGPFGVLAIGAMNYGQSLKKDRYVKAGLITPKNAQQPTALIQNLMAAGYQPGTPEFQQAMLSQLKQERGTTVEQQLEAAGYQPGTVEYQQAMQRYLFTPKSSVTVNNNPGQSYVPPGALGPVDPKDASKGYVYEDPNSPTGTKIVKPTGSTQATEGEVKSVGSLTAANDLLDQIDMAIDNGANVAGLIGLTREFVESPTWLGGAARFGMDTVDKYFGTDLSSTPADRQALTAMESLRALIGQYISGADVPQEQIDNFKKWMPAAGDRQERIREKNASLRKYINTLAQAGELRQRDAPKPAAPAENPEVEAAKQRLRNAGLLE